MMLSRFFPRITDNRLFILTLYKQTQLSLPNRATHLCNGVAYPLNTPLFVGLCIAMPNSVVLRRML